MLDVASTDTADHFAIERCAGCGVLRTTPVPDDLAPYYATDLAATMRRAGSPLFTALRAWQLERELARLARHGAAGAIVDVGCGAGDFARAAARRGLAVVACDSSPTPPAALAAEPGVVYAAFDFATYEIAAPLSTRPFTAVLRHVLEHVREPRSCLESLHRRGATHVYLVVPNADCRERRLLGAGWYLWDPPRHLWHFDARSLAALLERTGLTIVAGGTGTAPTLAPDLYRHLRLRGWPAATYRPFGPTGAIAALTAPLARALLPGNVLWAIARTRP